MTQNLRRLVTRLGCAAFVLGSVALAAGAQVQGESQMDDLKLGDAAQWKFVGEPWREDEAGLIQPPLGRDMHSRAFYTGKAFSNVTVQFEYRAGYMEGGAGSAGLILRARDGGHGYLVHFPWGGQTLRAKNHWAGLAKLEADGYLRHVRFDLVNGVPAETERWYSVKVEASGPRMRVWVDGCLALDVNDATYASGYLGLAGYGQYWFRNIRVSGAEATATPWGSQAPIRARATVLPLPSDPINQGCVAPNGDVIIASGNELLRSTDGARTWQKEKLPKHLLDISGMGNTIFTTADKRLIAVGNMGGYISQEEGPSHAFYMSESTDSGKTWSQRKRCPLNDDYDWPAGLDRNRNVRGLRYLGPWGPLVETADGALLRFTLGGPGPTPDYPDIQSWGNYGVVSRVFRSTDRGQTWSGPIEIDRPVAHHRERGSIHGSLDFTETNAVAMGNTVMAMTRPVYASGMWQSWSHDGGATWDASARASFPGYACSMTRLSSGAIVLAHRYPGYSVNVSRDGGRNWDAGTIIDWQPWGQGALIEVEPNVLLVTYMNTDLGDWHNLAKTEISPLLAQRFRVTEDRIVPLGPNE
jgi:hypothetical protein